jgi:hypothetical protein
MSTFISDNDRRVLIALPTTAHIFIVFHRQKIQALLDNFADDPYLSYLRTAEIKLEMLRDIMEKYFHITEVKLHMLNFTAPYEIQNPGSTSEPTPVATRERDGFEKLLCFVHQAQLSNTNELNFMARLEYMRGLSAIWETQNLSELMLWVPDLVGLLQDFVGNIARYTQSLGLVLDTVDKPIRVAVGLLVAERYPEGFSAVANEIENWDGLRRSYFWDR